MILTDLLICSLASAAAVDVWFQGSIFASTRELIGLRVDWCDTRETPEQEVPADDVTIEIEEVDTWVSRCPCLLAELLHCRFCLSHHISFWVCCWYVAAAALPSITEGLRLPLYALAVTKAVNLAARMPSAPQDHT